MAFVYRLRVLLEQREAALEEAQRELAARIGEAEEARGILKELEQRAAQAAEVAQTASREVTARSAAGQTVPGQELMNRVERARNLHREAGLAKDEVFEQRVAVQDAEDGAEAARGVLAEAMRAVEVLKKHRQRALEKYTRGEEQREAGEMDEAGVAVFNRGRQQKQASS